MALCAVAALLTGCGSSSPHKRSPIAQAEAKVEAATERSVTKIAGTTDEWLVYGICNTATRCIAELRFEGLPETTLAVDHYRVKNGRVRRVNPSPIEVFLTTDSIANCTGKYLTTENPADLTACTGH
jgi:hypothetical protein